MTQLNIQSSLGAVVSGTPDKEWFAIDINNFNRYVDEEETWNELNKGTKSTTYECPQGYYVANDGYCYPIDGGGGSFGDSCPNGYVLGTDDLCHEECGTNTYCLGDAQCYNSQCLICHDGQYLGIDGYCYPESGGDAICPDGYYAATEDYCCQYGYYYGGDGFCYPE